MEQIDNTELLSTQAGKHWNQIGTGHHHGINIPVFALHSIKSSGIGEYTDLIPLIEWCSVIGLDVIQVLPLNDPGSDKSPYNALSAFALNPLFLGLSSLPNIDKNPELKKSIESFKPLNQTDYVDYDQVREKKEEFLKNYSKLEFSNIKKDRAFEQFINENPWIKSYALFKVFKSHYRNEYWVNWPEEIRNPSPQQFEDLYGQYSKEMAYYEMVQFLCYAQMHQVKKIATSKKVYILGDIPILISPDSADVWAHPQIFDRNLRAGAPPDMYNKEGQDWGFPLYKWDELEKNGYHWWRERLNYASHFYHLYRIDHIVGFFRIWAIIEGQKPNEGSFVPSDERTWIDHGKKIMTMMLDSSLMLPIGEDLGTVPPEARVCLKELGICGTKVIRWERNWETDRSFIDETQYNPISLTTISTHDSPTLTLWWRDYPEEAQEYCKHHGWTYVPEITPELMTAMLRISHQTSSLFHVNLLNEYLALFPEMVSRDPDLERINLPGKINERNWTYRFLPSVEGIVQNKELKELFISFLNSPS